jgi:hypothetical protein
VEQTVKEQPVTKKKQLRSAPDSTAPLTRRIALLLKLVWAGKKSVMARNLGISHPVISRVVAGQQEPPGQLLLALANLPKVNLRWLFLGEGESLDQRDIGLGGGRYCPVAMQLLAGEPTKYPVLLSGTSLPVAEAYYTPSAYWVALGQDSSIVNVPEENLKAGDYLLMETSPDWTRRVERMHGRLVALRHTDNPNDIGLGRLSWTEADYIERPGEHPLTMYGAGAAVPAMLVEPTTVAAPKGRSGSAKTSKSKRGQERQYPIDAVVGVCVVIQRLR